MNERATRMLFAAAALSAFAAVLAGTANAYVPEGTGVPAEVYAASTFRVTDQQQSQQASVQEKLGEIGAWAVPSGSLQKPQLLQGTSVREKLGEVGAWASLDPAIKAAIMARSRQTPLVTDPISIPSVDPATFEGFRGLGFLLTEACGRGRGPVLTREPNEAPPPAVKSSSAIAGTTGRGARKARLGSVCRWEPRRQTAPRPQAERASSQRGLGSWGDEDPDRGVDARHLGVSGAVSLPPSRPLDGAFADGGRFADLPRG